MERRLAYKIPDAARLLSLGRSQVYVLIAKGELESIKIGRSRRITEDSLQTFLVQHKVDADDFGPTING